MEDLVFDTNKRGQKFKILNAVNGGPWHKRHADDQYHSNLADYTKARIPYARNHDSAVCGVYGGPYSHDVACIFPDFNADAYAPESYDFACTDEAIAVCLDAGTKTFFRLGQTIEHQIKKHGTIPPSDFSKWAVVCEHIIRHYTEGWADGYKYDMPYWEIWNEADLDRDDSLNKRCWGGTKAQFFDFYEIVSKHLKRCFPHLKIGGPALAGNEEWGEDFLCEMNKRNVELDFFSWHIYGISPISVMEKAERIKALLLKYGYDKTESILNEWNYVKGWTDKFIYSVKKIISMKGAAFTMACISAAQPSSIDMLMYYDVRPSIFNGVFDFYTCERLKGYYPLYWYGAFYDLDCEIKSENSIEDIYSICGCDKDGLVSLIVTYYSDDDDSVDKDIHIDFGRDGKYEVYLLDEAHDSQLMKVTEDLALTMKVNTCVMIKEIK